MRRSSDIWGKTRNTSSGRDWPRVPFSFRKRSIWGHRRQPDKIIGVGDVLFELRKLLTRERKVLDTFKQDPDLTFDKLTAIEDTYKAPPAP
ncbi:hypothetical protein OKW41_003017 [Paraburkholderia sp. UCT70]